MKPDTLLKEFLVERFGSFEAALDIACQALAEIIPATSMGMLRCGKKARNVDSEYGGK